MRAKDHKRKITYVIIVTVAIITFVFLVPVVPATMNQGALEPWRSQCIRAFMYPNIHFQSIPVYTSLSLYATRTYGLVYVPNDPGYSIQFMPMRIACPGPWEIV